MAISLMVTTGSRFAESSGIEPEFETQDFESEEQKLKTIVDVNSARRHYNKWELFESVMTKKPVIEAQVKAEQQLKYPKPGEKGLKPIDGDDEIASNDL